MKWVPPRHCLTQCSESRGDLANFGEITLPDVLLFFYPQSDELLIKQLRRCSIVLAGLECASTYHLSPALHFYHPESLE